MIKSENFLKRNHYKPKTSVFSSLKDIKILKIMYNYFTIQMASIINGRIINRNELTKPDYYLLRNKKIN